MGQIKLNRTTQRIVVIGMFDSDAKNRAVRAVRKALFGLHKVSWDQIDWEGMSLVLCQGCA